MHQDVLDLSGTEGAALLAAYVIGGLVTAAAGFLPGNRGAYRVLYVLLGLGMAGWAAKVLLFGGTIIISFYVLAMPVILTGRAVVGAFRSRRRPEPPLGPLTPHPATRTYTEHGPVQQGYAAPVFAHMPPAFPEAVQLPQPRPGRHASGESADAPVRARFNRHTIAPLQEFDAPPRFAPQPLHNVPRGQYPTAAADRQTWTPATTGKAATSAAAGSAATTSPATTSAATGAAVGSVVARSRAVESAAMGSAAVGGVVVGSAAVGSAAVGGDAVRSAAVGGAARGSAAAGGAAAGGAAVGSVAAGGAAGSAAVGGAAAGGASGNAATGGAVGSAAVGSGSAWVGGGGGGVPGVDEGVRARHRAGGVG